MGSHLVPFFLETNVSESIFHASSTMILFLLINPNMAGASPGTGLFLHSYSCGLNDIVPSLKISSCFFFFNCLVSRIVLASIYNIRQRYGPEIKG